MHKALCREKIVHLHPQCSKRIVIRLRRRLCPEGCALFNFQQIRGNVCDRQRDGCFQLLLPERCSMQGKPEHQKIRDEQAVKYEENEDTKYDSQLQKALDLLTGEEEKTKEEE